MFFVSKFTVTAFATSGDLSQVVKSQSYGPTTEITDISVSFS
jgi:hypothetical protein